jgi:hypothetical protein
VAPARGARRSSTPSQAELEVSVPRRGYRLAAQLLARAVDARPRLWVMLERLGYRPYRDGDLIALRNCPFRRLAEEHTDLICGLNLALMEGIAGATTPDGPRAWNQPHPLLRRAASGALAPEPARGQPSTVIVASMPASR